METMYKILVVDDDPEMVSALEELLQRQKFQVVTALSGNEALEKAAGEGKLNLALVDLVMPVMDGFTLIEGLHEIDDQLDIIVITGHGTIHTAVAAIKLGAKDFVIKPFDKDYLLGKIASLRETDDLKKRVNNLEGIVSREFNFDNIVSRSPAMKTVFEKASYASRSDANVFIIGETGTGKGLIAKAIHINSQRKNFPFVSINCASIPRELLESELFGHRKGSFTSAVRDHTGLLVSAGDGTVFMDEIGEMPKDMQVKILNVLEEHRLRPIGSTEQLSFKARFIAATNRTIEELKTMLREDLFFRLAIIVIEIPPLRKRRDDIPLLAQYFIDRFNKKYSRNIGEISDDALDTLLGYQFPGNVRELENLIEGIIAVSPENKDRIVKKDIKSHLLWYDAENESKYSLMSLQSVEKFAIDQALREADGNKSKAAEILGISRDTLYRKLRQIDSDS